MKFFIDKPYRVYLFLSLLLNIESLLGPLRPISPHDSFDQRFVAIKTFAENFWKFTFSGWDPTVITGNPSLLLGLSPFNPVSFLTCIFPLWCVYSMWLFLASFVALYGTHLYFHAILRLPLLSAYLGSILFLTLCQTMFYIEHTFIYAFPLYLTLFHQWTDANYTQKIVHTLLLFILIISSSMAYTVPYFPLIHLLMILGLENPLSRKVMYVKKWILFWGCFALIHAPTIYSLFSEVPHSQRAEFAKSLFANESFLMVALTLISRIWRALPTSSIVLLALMTLSFYQIRNKNVLFWWLFLIFMMIFLVIDQKAGSEIAAYLGMFQGLSLSRIFEVLHVFVFCLLSAYGLSAFFQTEKKNLSSFVLPAVIFIVGMGLLLLVHHSTWMHPHSRQAKLNVGYFILAATGGYLIFSSYLKKEYFWGSLIVILLFCTKYEFFQGRGLKNFNFYFHDQNMITVAQQLKKESLSRSVIYNGKWLMSHPSFLQYHGMQTADAYLVVYPIRYKKLWAKMLDSDSQKFSEWKNYFHSWGNRVYLPFSVKGDVGINSHLLSLFNVKYVFSNIYIDYPEEKNLTLYLPQQVDSKSLEPKSTWDKLTYYLNEKKSHLVYTLKTTLPRSFVVSQWDILEEEKAFEMLGQMRAEEFLKKTVFIDTDIKEKENFLKSNANPFQWSSEILEYKPDRIKLKGFTTQGGFLILTDQYHKNWKAKVNGVLSDVFPAYTIFRGVFVPQGEFMVEFEYKDIFFKISYIFVFLGILILLLSTVPSIEKKKDPNGYEGMAKI